MTDPTIARGATTFATSTTTTLTLYNAQSEEFRKSANLITMPLPASDSSSTIAFDLLGVTREITIRGFFVETGSPVTVTNFTSDLNSLVKGTQGNTGGAQVGYTFTPTSISGTIKVYVNDVTWTWNAGEPTKLEYSISLLEVSTSSA